MSSEDSVELIVRCAEKCETDYNISCKRSWSVATLKTQIEAQVPSHPKAETQRLIYAGHLLKDSATLSDVLRSYSSDQLQVVHLVQTREFNESQPVVQSPVRRRRIPPVATATQQPPTTQQHPTANMSVPNFLGNLPYGGQQVDQNAMNAWLQTQQYYSLYMANYLTYIQQIYGPMYNFPSMGASFSQTPGSAPVVTPQTMPSGQPQTVPIPQQNPAAQPQAPANEAQAVPAAEQAMNAQGGVEEEVRDRDWLDWCYVASRFAFLVMILYFYSSIERFLFVMICVTLVYAYQAGWFSRNFGRQLGPVPADNANEPDPIPMPNIPNPQREVADVNTTPPANELVVVEPSAWHVFCSTCYIFITSFFASLIPQRPPPVNLN